MMTKTCFVAALLLTGLAHAQGPTPNSVAAALATAQDNEKCISVRPFYWQIGGATGSLVSASEGLDSTGQPVLESTMMNTASAGKWLYGTYIVQKRGSAANLTSNDITFLHMTSGYSNMGGDPQGACPPTDNPDDVDVCLLNVNKKDGLPFDYQNPETIGVFYYDGGHIENHAKLYGGIGTVINENLGAVIASKLGPGVAFTYSEPLLPGAVYTNAGMFARVLQHIVNGSLYMHDALGIDPVCTKPSATCDAQYSPIPAAWHYSITHWVEDDPVTNGDGAFSSPGGEGFYPWIEASKQYYGVLARAVGGGGANQYGYGSSQCGALIRAAWDTGVQQKGPIPERSQK
jgi:hypothetical protein